MKQEIEIYRESFGVCEEFESLLFKDEPLTYKEQGNTVSQLFLLPCLIKAEDKSYETQYIFAACTKESERKKGYMKKLLKKTLAENSFLILRPANKGLIDYYKKFGFKEFTAQDRKNKGFYVEPLGNFNTLARHEGKTDEGDFTIMAINYPLNLNEIYFPCTLP